MLGLWAAAAIAFGAGSPGAEAQTLPPAKQQQRTQRVNLPLLVDDRFVGDIAAEFAPGSSEPTLAIEDVERVLGTVLDADTRARLLAAATSRPYLTIADFTAAGMDLSYDPMALELRLRFPVTSSRPNSISLFGASPGDLTADRIEPEPFAAALTLTASQTISTAQGSYAFEPFRGFAQLSAAIGGSRGVFLFSDLGYEGGAPLRFKRGQTVLIHDDQPRALRYYLGDIQPDTQGFQGAPPLGGIGFARNYQELQPNRNIRPAGLFRFSVETPSLVEITVNGAPVRTLRLERGQYDIRDFNFVTGLNQIEIFARDEYGQRTIARFDQFFDFGLLAEGLDEFGVFAGGKQVLSGRGQIAYDFDHPVVTGFYRRALSATITAGADLQAERGRVLAGSSIVAATGLGSLALLAGISRDNTVGTGSRVLLSYQATGERFGPIQQPTVNLEAGHTSARFLAVGQNTLNTIAFDLRARATGTIGTSTGFGVSASYTTRRQGQPNSYQVSVSASRRIGPFGLTATAEQGRNLVGRSERRFLLTLGLPLGKRGNLRASYDTRSDLAQLEFSRFRNDVLGDWGARGSLSRNASGVLGSAEVSYNANRALFTVQHVASADGGFGSAEHRTNVTATTQIAIAGNRIGFGRPVGPNFVLAYPHETLKSRVEIAQGVELEKIQARSGALGPALGTAGAAYSDRRVTLRAPEAPIGYDTGPGYYNLLPAAVSGYRLQVGSDANYSVLGTLRTGDGTAIPLLAGTIRSLDRPDAKPVSVFTNRAGRFIANGLVAGRHRIELGKGAFVAEIEVTDDGGQTINLGIVTAREGEDK